jgi:hypothetical protein
MKKIVKVIQKSDRIKKRLLNMLKDKPNNGKKRINHKKNDELDDQNDSNNWSYC